jgi:hypothetical protein
MSVKLIKRGTTWVTEFMGKERHFILENDLVNWRSMGILPTSAIEFDCELDGTLLTATEIRTGNALEELDIPSNHVVAKMVIPTKPFVVKE